jgi:hypothetical protein
VKSVDEIQELLIAELEIHKDKIVSTDNLDYYNNLLGDTSFLLAGLLNQQLKEQIYSWDHDKWIDDSLITKVEINQNKLLIWGIMIWGRNNTTAQWTDPFYFEIILEDLDADKEVKYIFLFGDSNSPEIPYEKFNNNRNLWDKDFYSTDEWDIQERDWKYRIIKWDN